MNAPLPDDATTASSPIPTLTLPTGAPIPTLGFGTYKVAPEDTYDAVSRALEVGYRHIDTAQMYGNEAEVGAALDASGIPREQIFLTTKVDNSNHEPERAAASIAQSLEELRTDCPNCLDVLALVVRQADRACAAGVESLLEGRPGQGNVAPVEGG